MTITCPCGETIVLEVTNGVTYYVHENGGDCPIYEALGLSLGKVFADEYTKVADPSVRAAMFLASRTVRLSLYEIIATHSQEQLYRDFRTLKTILTGSALRVSLLSEMVTVFGQVFQINWSLVNQESIFNMQTLVDPLPKYTKMKTIDSKIAMQASLDYERNPS